MEPWLRFIHIAAAAVWVGGGATLAFVAARARNSADAGFVIGFARMIQLAGPRVLAPAMVILLLAGIGLVIVQAHAFTETWILVALAGFAIAFLIGAVFLSRVGIELNRVVNVAQPDVARVRELIARWFTAYAIVLAVLVVVLWDMVFKPGM